MKTISHLKASATHALSNILTLASHNVRAGVCLNIVWLLLAFVSEAMAQSDFTSPYFESADARDAACSRGITIWTENWDDMPDQSADYHDFDSDDAKYPGLHFRRMRNRHALVGEGCTVNKLITVVGVGAWSKNLNALTNEDLDDYAEFNKVVGAGVTVDPVVSIRDMHNYYSRGTKAGYCIVASSGSAVLTLDVIKAMSIGFYRDGKLLGVKAVSEGQDGSGVTLKLIQIPGSEEACIMLTAESDWLFDEISLDHSGGIQVGVGDLLKVKYAFVGDSHEYTITYDGTSDSGQTLKGGISQYNDDVTPDDAAQLDYVKGWDPVVLGLPFPFTDNVMKKLTDYDTDNYIALSPIISVAYRGGAKFMMKRADGTNGEVYPEGMEVGFNYNIGSGLSLNVGEWIELVLFDRNGNKVQEETVSAGVLGLSIAKGGNGTASVLAKQPFSGCEIRFMGGIGIEAGAIGIHYGFVKKKPETPHHCPIDPSPDTNLCSGQTSFQLRSNTEVSVTWTLESALPDDDSAPRPQVTATGYVTNLSPGYYTFRASATDGCYDLVQLSVGHFGNEDLTCTRPISNGMTEGNYVVSTDIYGSSGSLISASELKDAEAIVSKSTEDYATYIGGLSLASNLRVTGVKRTDGLIYDATGRHDGETTEEAIERAKPKRIGFVVANFVTGLDLSLLQYLQVRCYHEGKEVYRHVISESNGVQAGLAEQSGTQRTRYSIEVPAMDNDGLPTQVDEIMLWTSGVLNLRGSNLRIYCAFIENADAGCSDPMGCGVTVLDNDKTHTTINADATKGVEVVSVANTVDNLSYLIDGDITTPMLVLNTVTVGAGQVVAVNMGRTMDYHHQVGIVVDQKTYVANIGVGNWLTVETYYQGVATGDKKSDWSVLGADVAGYGDKDFLFIQPTHIYDELRITIGGVVDAAEPQKFYGLFIRGDVDNDGIPDCRDPESCAQQPLTVTVNHVCVGDKISIKAKGYVDTDYTIEFGEPGIASVTLKSDAKDGTISYEYTTQKAGRYQMMFYDGSGNFINAADYTVHPRQTTWLTTASNNDWNKWDNWSNGSPYCCTDAIIPSGAKHYPVLDTKDVTTGDEFCCNDIFFEPVTAVEHTERLCYDKAWVELALKPNRYYNFAAPLKRMYTGDMFVNESVTVPERFSELNADSYAASRFDPSVYQRLWMSTGKSHKWTTGNATDDYQTVEVDASNWSHHFNNLAHAYDMGQGYGIWVDNGESGKDVFVFRFPKMHTQYNYFDDYDKQPIEDVTETINRGTGNEPYRFVYENENEGNLTYTTNDGSTRTIYNAQSEWDITLTAEKQSTTFLMGNPFMSYIDIGHLLNYNTHVKGVKVEHDGSIMTVSRTDDGSFVYNGGVKAIAPMEAVFLETADSTTSLNVTLTTDMLAASAEEASTQAVQACNAPSLRLIVDGGASVTLVDSKEATSATLFDSEVQPTMSVFGIDDGNAFDIMSLADYVPLGICCNGSKDICLTFYTTNAFRRDAYVLRDNLTGTDYALDMDVNIKGVSTSVGRFAIVKKGYDTSIAKNNATTDHLIILTDNNAATIKSATKDVRSVSVMDTTGRLLRQIENVDDKEAHIELSKGINIIEVVFADGEKESRKIMI